MPPLFPLSLSQPSTIPNLISNPFYPYSQISQSSTCQCTQCRKQTSTLFLVSHRIRPASTAYRFTTPTTTLKDFEASPRAQRGFCAACGSLLYWRSKDPGRDELSGSDGGPS